MSFKRFLIPVLIVLTLVLSYFAVVLHWSYSSG